MGDIEITSKNMFHGAENYAITEKMLGAITLPRVDRYDGSTIVVYNNPVFTGTLRYESTQIHGSLLVAAKFEGKDYHCSNGLCDSDRAPESIPFIKDVIHANDGNDLIGQYDIERFMFEKLYP